MKKYMFHIIICLIFLIGGDSDADAKKYFFRHFDTADGLSQNTVNSILQDKNGFLWFATKDGLNRYDGATFQVFKKNNSELGNNFINVIHEDSKGFIWIGTEHGIYVYNPDMESISHFSAKIDGPNGNVNDAVRWIGSDNKGNVYVALVNQGLLRYDEKRKILVQDYKELNGKTVSFFTCSDGIMWISIFGGNLYTARQGSKKLSPFLDHTGNEIFFGKNVHDMKFVDNEIFVATEQGIFKVNIINRKTERIIDGFFRTICLTSDKSDVWTGSQNGIFIINRQTDEIKHILQPDIDEPFSIADDAIYALYPDREGGIWIGSYFGGINYCSIRNVGFEKFFPSQDLPFMGRRIREMCQDKNGMVWIGTEDKGLLRFNPQDNSLSPVTTHLQTKNIHGLCADGDYVFVGAFDGGLEKININNGAYKTYFAGNSPGQLNSNYVFAIFRDREGIVWVGTTDGIMTYDAEHDSFVNIPDAPGYFIYNIIQDNEGKIWLATYSNGLYSYDKKTGKFQHFQYQDGKDGTIADSKVISLYCDSKNRIWVMTHDGGLSLLNPKTGIFKLVSLSQDNRFNLVYKMVEDRDGNLWCSTNNGLVCFNPETGKKTMFTMENGLQTNHFNYQSGMMDAAGFLYFGTVNGFVRFRPDVFQMSDANANIVLSALFIDGVLQRPATEGSPLSKSINLTKQLTLEHNQNSFSIVATVLTFLSPQRHSMKYMLEGFDKEWKYMDDEYNEISYSNIPYGNYKLKIVMEKNSGNGVLSQRNLDIYIKPPFYLSQFAKIIYVLLALAIIAWIVWWFMRFNKRKLKDAQERLEREKQKELYDSKISFFTTIAHEIRTPLTLIKSPLEAVLQNKDLPKEVKDNLNVMDMNAGRLMALINQLLDFRKTESNGMKINLQKVNVSSVVQLLLDAFSTTIQQKGIQLHTDIQQDVWAEVDRDVFGKIIANLMSNALKYADKEITLQLKSSGDQFSVCETNDGKIIPLEMRSEIFKPFTRLEQDDNTSVTGTGLGLALTRSLVELHGGDISMDDDTSVNRFLLTMPLKQKDSVFEMQMNIANAEEQQVEKAENVSEETNDLDNKGMQTLLFVEDNLQLLDFLMKHFANSYRVLTAHNGQEALDIVGKENVNLIVSDVMMPVMDGIQLCKKIKNNIEYSHIPVILLTAKTTEQDRVEGLGFGADAYLDKPFSMPVLEQTIQMLIENRRRLYENFSKRPLAIVSTIVCSETESEFLKQLTKEILEHLDDSEYDVDQLALAMNMSRSSLNRKIKTTLNMTPNDYIRVERLKKSVELLKTQKYKVNEVCYMVGFNTPSYFAKCFQRQYGVLPSEIDKVNDIND